MPKPKEYKLPKTLAGCADALYTIRAERLVLQRAAEALSTNEGLLREYIIANLPKSQATGISGKVANAKIERKEVPQIVDKAALQKYIKRTGAFELLQNRLSESAVLERWADKKTVPGVEAFTVLKVSCTKI